MTGRPLASLGLSTAEEEGLRSLAGRRKTAQALALRARIVLACAAGEANQMVAAKLGVTPPAMSEGPLSQSHAEAMTNLRALSGAAFDKAYVANEVTYHAAVIQAVQNDLMPAIQNVELRALVEKVAPAFQAHHDAAQALQAKLGN